jgi:hypothetical protein
MPPCGRLAANLQPNTRLALASGLTLESASIAPSVREWRQRTACPTSTPRCLPWGHRQAAVQPEQKRLRAAQEFGTMP